MPLTCGVGTGDPGAGTSTEAVGVVVVGGVGIAFVVAFGVVVDDDGVPFVVVGAFVGVVDVDGVAFVVVGTCVVAFVVVAFGVGNTELVVFVQETLRLLHHHQMDSVYGHHPRHHTSRIGQTGQSSVGSPWLRLLIDLWCALWCALWCFFNGFVRVYLYPMVFCFFVGFESSRITAHCFFCAFC